ncbi:bifunctional homocysteine S-methyltransferase/methylenetetrahydrofolate reductase [Shouchella clausii]|uniref:bifunctional homocysteine S-methyltransferase/methylenetetrahydrofolate reductase n=1 Tax=Shouchella clausii TaxID=79880 RepID=UPI000BA55A05|nr:bifunctional homocysteine S-methyltransferase/methylenetetrahydrofolate reductase [Shouchella clausii]MBU8597745.1 bifunctional homocysteine S-methyltransferase/methylenetetrahydrofolate reductase [Shouchella clausii]MCY1104295.1 bifunctional homocysteine S-methyltransferase/methylenetetrahydrofolate reductase [Shouchella clausii]PAD09670.1 bifunctional homocysteine S-methyltransferase/methylenetetrahydrofolate reductase [Shouchella clausii]PAE84088.1 bifunctional homocysteine S-methyltransf
MELRDKLKTSLIVGDGAMGTLLYEQGFDLCYEELNLSQPDAVYNVHRSYIEAGAKLLQTNTYAANAVKLKKYGLDESVADINNAAVSIAKKAIGNDEQLALVGTIGGIRGFLHEETENKAITAALLEQITALLEAGVDGLLFETFYDFEEAKEAVALARRLTDKAIIMNVSMGDIGVLNGGIPLGEALERLHQLGADVLGINCRMGPYHMLRSLEQLELSSAFPLACYPNASLPGYRDGRFVYASNTDYFYEMTGAFIEQGVHLIGGCCGTTPGHIAAIAKAVETNTPKTRSLIVRRPSQLQEEAPGRGERLNEPLDQLARRKQTIIVELDPPKKLTIAKFMEGAKALKEAGVDALTLADNSLANPRIDNQTLAMLVREQLGLRSLVHLTCRDRNLIGMQSHLMGLHLAELHDLLVITGDPSKIGDFPGATSVYDVSSLKLLPLIKQMNEGISFSGNSLGSKASFSTAAAFNPHVKHLDKAVRRLEKKIEAGADYFLTQPIFDEQQFEQLYNATKHLPVPIFVGIMPLTSSRNAEFLHNEVPGMTLSDETRARMAACGNDKEKAEQEGLQIAMELADAASTYFNGLYLVTPFLRYELTAALATHCRAIANPTNHTMEGERI